MNKICIIFESLNLRSNAKFRHGSVKLFALLSQYNKDAAYTYLSPQQIKKREMEVHQACIGVMVRELNKYSYVGGEVDVLCPDGKVYCINLHAHHHSVLGFGPRDDGETLPHGNQWAWQRLPFVQLFGGRVRVQ